MFSIIFVNADSNNDDEDNDELLLYLLSLSKELVVVVHGEALLILPSLVILLLFCEFVVVADDRSKSMTKYDKYGISTNSSRETTLPHTNDGNCKSSPARSVRRLNRYNAGIINEDAIEAER